MKVFTNAEKVEFVVNGKVVGIKENSIEPSERNTIKFNNVEYQPGYIEAIAHTGGRRIATHRVETTDKARKLYLEADLQQ